MKSEKILNVYPTADGKSRLVIAVESAGETSAPGSEASLVLRQESFSEDVGWFIQSRVAVEPEQIPGLKMTLTGGETRKIQSASPSTPRPTVLRFADAVAS